MCVIVRCVKYAHFVKVQLTSCTQTCSNGCVNVHCDILTSVHMYRCFHDCVRVCVCVCGQRGDGRGRIVGELKSRRTEQKKKERESQEKEKRRKRNKNKKSN